MNSPTRSDLFDSQLFVGVWFGMKLIGGLGMLQFRFNVGGTFEFVDYSRGEQMSGTYYVAGNELVLRNASTGGDQRRRIISCRPGRIVLEFPEYGQELVFDRDRPAS